MKIPKTLNKKFYILLKNCPSYRGLIHNQYINEEWDYVITVCDHANETCPLFTGKVRQRLHIGFEDPSAKTGTEDFIMSEFRRIRNLIKDEFYRFYIEKIKPELT